MTCPYCNSEMVLGVIHGDRYSLKWHPKTNYSHLFQNPFQKGIKITEYFDGNYFECYYCERCQKMIFDVPEQ